jgi:hypothetical protein
MNLNCIQYQPTPLSYEWLITEYSVPLPTLQTYEQMNEMTWWLGRVNWIWTRLAMAYSR